MNGFSRFYSRLNSSFGYVKAGKLASLRDSESKIYKNAKILRYQSTVGKFFKGPGLVDFLAKPAITGSGEEFNCVKNDPVPYVDEADIDGEGRKVYFLVHGCQMNTSDTEIVWSILKSNGYQRTKLEEEADVVLIMTCAIRESAEEKILNHLVRLKAVKRKNSKKKPLKIGVLGCMAERLKSEIMEKVKEVDLVAGPDSYKDLPRLLMLTRNNQKAVNVLLSLEETYADIMPVKLNENEVSAYVSIMRGCDNMCTYCIVPFTRGRERSRPLESILEEVKFLSQQGIKQVTLLGQNVNSYRDTSVPENNKQPSKLVAGFKTVYKNKLGGIRFDVLLDRVSQIDPNMRIRFTSPHPKDFPDEVLYLIRDRKNICCGLHLPAQSGSNAVLERMRRGHTVEAYLDLVKHIKSVIPKIFLTTDIITGFCGETEKDHEDTLELLRKVEFSFVYHFPYSMREKTTAYRRYKDDVPHEVKMRRSKEINEVFRSICLKRNKSLINQTHLVLIEGISKKSKFLFGRNDGNCSVFIPITDVPTSPNSARCKPVNTGDYIAVQVTDANAQSIYGKPLYHTSVVDFDESGSIVRLSGEPVSSARPFGNFYLYYGQ